MAEEAYGTLPFRVDWRYRPYDFPKFTLAPGEVKTLIDLRRRGWVIGGVVLHDNPEMVFALELETGTEVYRVEGTAKLFYTSGLVQAQPTGFWVPLYDTTRGLYCLNFTPSRWWPFYRRLSLELINRTESPITVYRTAILCIEFIGVPP